MTIKNKRKKRHINIGAGRKITRVDLLYYESPIIIHTPNLVEFASPLSLAEYKEMKAKS